MQSKILPILLIATIYGCYYHSEEELFSEEGSECDSLDISFTLAIKPILENNCYVCHSNSNAPQFGSNLKLEDYPDVKLLSDDGSLLGTIRHESGYSPMPRGGR